MSLIPPLPPLSPPPTNPSTTSNSSATSPPAPTTSRPNTPPSSPPQPPPAVPAAPPPSPPLSPPTELSSPPPSSAPPPSPPATTAPPPVIITPPPPSILSPPPPVVAASPPPPQPAPSTPAATPPPTPPQAIPPDVPPPPPLKAKPPKSSHSPPTAMPPPSDSPPATTTPPTASLPPPPPQSVPPTSFHPTISPPNNLTNGGSSTMSPLPIVPTEKPTAKSTKGATELRNSTNSDGGLNTGGAIAIGIVVGFMVLTLLVMAVWLVQRRRKRDSGTFIGYSMPSAFSSPQNSDVAFLNPHSAASRIRSASGSDFIYSPSESGVVSNQRSWFAYEELAEATDGFSTQNLLGEGGFGCVYKGILSDGTEVAVKQLKIGGSQGEREYRAEVEIITRVHHRHLVSLVGYCISEQHRLLVYDYVPNNTLHYHLHDQGRPVMAWATRVKVAAGAARGIAYLHEDCHPRIIHRDIKSSNILLDNKFEAQVSDFGLAKIAQELDSNTHVSTRVMGTFGYMAPEYATSGKLSEKSDVYSFGVVLLELITGRKPVDASQPLGDESLVEWARPLLAQAVEHEFEELVDSKLENNYVPSEMFRMMEAAAACVRHSAAKRPKMSQVVRALDTLEEITDITNGMKPGQSQVFDSRQQSAQIRMFQRLAFGGSQEYSSSFFNQTQSSWRSQDFESKDYGDRSKYLP